MAGSFEEAHLQPIIMTVENKETSFYKTFNAIQMKQLYSNFQQNIYFFNHTTM